MIFLFRLLLTLCIVCLNTACQQGLYHTNKRALEIPLKDQLGQRFLIGTALSDQQIAGKDGHALDLVSYHFDSVTAENAMKWSVIHPQPEKYSFNLTDKLVKYAKENHLLLVGNMLAWHQKTPQWVFLNDSGYYRSKAELLEIVSEHMQMLAERYPNVGGWDVVNDAFNDNGALRSSPWRIILGQDYIVTLFQLAAEAAPTSELYYNDSNLWLSEKRQAVVSMVQSLRQKDIRIDGIGIQGHFSLEYPNLDELEQALIDFAALGLKVIITELDVSVLPFPQQLKQGIDISQRVALQAIYDPYPNQLSEIMEKRLAARYQALFELFNNYAHVISRVTFAGLHDGQSWRNYWPIEGRTDYPLLIDRNQQLKPWVQNL